MPLPRSVSSSDILQYVVITIIIILITIAFLPYGQLRLTYDSYDLMAAGKDLATYLKGRNADGHAYLVRAPLHPFILSFFQNKMIALWWVNLICLITALCLIYIVGLEIGLTKILALINTLAVVLCYPWLMNFRFFWTEPVFIVLILMLCYLLLKQKKVAWILAVCLLLFLTRKPGIFFFPAVATFYYFTGGRKKATIMFASGILFFVAWQWLEYSFDSSGYFGVMLTTLDAYHRIYYFDAVTTWFLPRLIPLALRIVICVVVIAAFAFRFQSALWRWVQVRQHLLLLSLAGVYTVIFVSFSGATGYEDAERYLNVVFPLWALLITALIKTIFQGVSVPVRITIVIILSVWSVYPISRTLHYLLD